MGDSVPELNPESLKGKSSKMLSAYIAFSRLKDMCLDQGKGERGDYLKKKTRIMALEGGHITNNNLS